jgi:serine/threonine-protein kinase
MTAIPPEVSAALADRYVIERELGQGGMATVYLAEDLKHQRKVAIKVLRRELAAVLGADRFVQEIRTTANLQHPNILPLFDSGEAGGLLYYVMPYVAGETLRQRLDREKQLAIPEAVRITAEVAEALDYAHRHAVIHRDIKPENILLHDGRPVVADFGIALAVSAAAGGRMTETGLSLGTPHYMSPEQATAEKDITRRSDIYSLGAVLYEMLTGDPPHTGASAQQIIMRIITEEPRPVSALRHTVPPNVAAAVEKALEKLPADRFENAKAFGEALSDTTFTTQATAHVATAPIARWNALTISLAAVATVAVVALVAVLAARTAPEPRVARYNLAGPAGDSAASISAVRHVAISADGSRLAWIASDGSIWTRRRDALDVQNVEIGERTADVLALSPDGRELAVTIFDSLFVTSPAGGGIHSRADSAFLGGVDWSDDGYLYFTHGKRIHRVPSGGGSLEALTDDSAGRPEWEHFFGKALPGGRGFVFVSGSMEDDTLEFRAWDARTRRSHAIAPLSGDLTRVGFPVGYHDGYLLTVTTDRTLWATRFDLRRLRALSDPQALVQGVRFEGLPAAAMSAAGDVIMATGARDDIHLATVTLEGRVSPLPVTGTGFRGVRLSPDGRRVAYGSSGNTFVHDLSIGSTRQLAPWNSYDPVWSRDGKRITVHANRPASDSALATLGWDGIELSADGSGMPRRLYRHPRADGPQAWTPDGRLIAHGSHEGDGGKGHDLFVISFDGDSARVETLLDAPWAETMPSLSPDGKWMAYRANPSGRNAVFVRRFPDAAAGVWQVSERTATDPMWSRDGRTLYYWEGPALIAARVQTSPDFAVLSRQTLFSNIGYAPPFCCRSNYDVLTDGSGFIMVLNSGARESNARLTLVEGLITELKRAGAQQR